MNSRYLIGAIIFICPYTLESIRERCRCLSNKNHAL